MKIFLNTQIQRIVIGTNQPSDVTQIDVKRGDNANFDCYAVLNFGDPYELDASVILTDFRLTAKVAGNLGAEDFVISALTWSKNGTGTSTFYRLTPSLDTTALNDLFAVGGIIATPATAAARLALTGLVVGNIVRQVDTGIYYQVLNASLLATISIPATAGANTGGNVASVDILGSAYFPGLPTDQTGKPTLPMAAGSKLYVGLVAALTNNKVLYVTAVLEDY